MWVVWESDLKSPCVLVNLYTLNVVDYVRRVQQEVCMDSSKLGKVLIIANPAAHSGDGAKGARFARNFFETYHAATESFKMVYTTGVGDAIELAKGASGYDTVIALGGDGVIHEVACGLMSLAAGARPKLAILPIGSGNDYARTLGMKINDIEGAAAEIVRGREVPVELARVSNERGESTYAIETLSFGLDAAIALDTTDRRARDTKAKGEALFITSGIKILSQNIRGRHLKATFDDGETEEMESILFAVQVGPTYGGGFNICPDADASDGLLNCCFNVKRPLATHAMALFGMARSGRHVKSKVLKLRTLRSVTLDFEQEPPTQVDGEYFSGTHFEIEVVPEALTVIVPKDAPLQD